VELCSGLLEGGVTPSLGLIQAVCRALAPSRTRVFVLIRPRAGDFVYSSAEIDAMVADVEVCSRLGAHGVAVGALLPDGSIDLATTRRLVNAARPMEVTFHRAFDLAKDAREALRQLMELGGVARVLTSGQQNTAMSGVSLLRELVGAAAGRMIVVAGAGITDANAQAVVNATGVREIHGSARTFRKGPMEFRRAGIFMGGEKRNLSNDETEYGMKIADEEIVRKLCECSVTTEP
jgi:copper homeostasis protein